MKKFAVTIKTSDGSLSYEGLFKSSFDAVLDALNKSDVFCQVKVRAL
jgi:hypothetical protein